MKACPFLAEIGLRDNLEIIESTKVPLAGLLFLELAQIRQTVESEGREAEHNLGLSDGVKTHWPRLTVIVADSISLPCHSFPNNHTRQRSKRYQRWDARQLKE